MADDKPGHGQQQGPGGRGATGPDRPASPRPVPDAAGSRVGTDAGPPVDPRGRPPHTGRPSPTGKAAVPGKGGAVVTGKASVPAAGARDRPEPARPETPGLQLRPVLQVADMAAALDFWTHLGAEVVHGGRDSEYVLLQLGLVQVGLVARKPNPLQGPGAVELNFAAALPLVKLTERLRAAGVTITDSRIHEDLGYLEIRSPDGLLIKISQLEPDVYP